MLHSDGEIRTLAPAGAEEYGMPLEVQSMVGGPRLELGTSCL